MGRALERRLKQRPLKDPIIEGILNLLVAAAVLNEQFDGLYGRYGLTSSAFNVLRILRGAPDGHPRGEIGQRLVHRSPDVTRLIDRLARRGLVRRVAAKRDRRVSLTQITPKGLDLVAAIEPAIMDYRQKMAARLSLREWRLLNELVERVYGEDA